MKTDYVPELEPLHSDYLRFDEVVDGEHPTLVELLDQLQPAGDQHARAESLFLWVRDRVSHSVDAGNSAVSCAASEVATLGTGLCYAKAHLLVALLRALKIPSGFGYQRLRADGPESAFVLHGFCFFYSTALSRFVPLDPRGNNAELQTEFAVDGRCLAFTPRQDWGEFTCLTVFSKPAPVIVRALRNAQQSGPSAGLSSLLRQLPGDL